MKPSFSYEISLMERLNQKLESGEPLDETLQQALKQDPEAAEFWSFWTQGTGAQLASHAESPSYESQIQQALAIARTSASLQSERRTLSFRSLLSWSIAAAMVILGGICIRPLLPLSSPETADHGSLFENLLLTEMIQEDTRAWLDQFEKHNAVAAEMLEREKWVVQNAVTSGVEAMISPLTIFKTITTYE